MQYEKFKNTKEFIKFIKKNESLWSDNKYWLISSENESLPLNKMNLKNIKNIFKEGYKIISIVPENTNHNTVFKVSYESSESGYYEFEEYGTYTEQQYYCWSDSEEYYGPGPAALRD